MSRRARYRIRFGKQDDLRYTGNLDIARIWERTLRRAGAPVVYSNGFNPRPKLQIAAALPLGYSSVCEIVDVWLEGDVPAAEDLLAALQGCAPEGLRVDAVWEVDDAGPALQNVTRSAVYRVTLVGVPAQAFQQEADALFAQDRIVVGTGRKTQDIRGLLESIVIEGEDPLVARLELSLSQRGGTLRPDVVLEQMGFDPLAARIERIAIHYAESID